MNKKFKPCLFCGSTDIDIIAYNEEYHTRRVAECINCGARGSVSDSVEEAIESWNTRPIEDEKDKRIESLKEVIADIGTIVCTGPVNLDIIFGKCTKAIGEPALTEAYLKEIRKRAEKIGKK